MVDVSVASVSEVWAEVTCVWAEATLALSGAIWAGEAPSRLIGGELGLIVGQGGLGLGEGRRQRRGVDGGQGLTGRHRLAGGHIDGGDPAGDGEVEVGLAGRLDRPRRGDRLGDRPGRHGLDRRRRG